MLCFVTSELHATRTVLINCKWVFEILKSPILQHTGTFMRCWKGCLDFAVQFSCYDKVQSLCVKSFYLIRVEFQCYIRGNAYVCVCVGSIANCAVCDSHTLFDTISLFLCLSQIFVLTVWLWELFMLPLFLLLLIGWNYFHITPGMASYSQDLVSAVMSPTQLHRKWSLISQSQCW